MLNTNKHTENALMQTNLQSKKYPFFVKKNCHEKLKNQAFTLAELLTAILIISIIMVALAPVITKRMKDNVSVVTDNKKGLEIFTNPGTYTFDVPIGINTLFIQGSGGGGGGAGASFVDKSVRFETTQYWTVPTGVNQITFTITGSGGGGGAANGATISGVYPNSYGVPKDKCWNENIEEKRIMRGADDGSDMCMTLQNVNSYMSNRQNYWVVPLQAPDKICTSGECCWAHTSNGIRRDACTYKVAQFVCAFWGVKEAASPGVYNLSNYRLPTNDEFYRIGYYENSSPGYLKSLNLCNGLNLGKDSITPGCTYDGAGSRFGPCLGVEEDQCQPWQYYTAGGQFGLHGTHGYSGGGLATTIPALSVRCVRSLPYYTRYNGAGGASGAVLTRTINVLPGDILYITIGTGGTGAPTNSNGAKGSQGGTTQIIHKRNGSTLATYYVKGGLGGNGATKSAHGAAYGNGTGSGQTTPSGTCYANASVGCNAISYSGNAGGANNGGNGGRVKDAGVATSGGIYYEAPLCYANKNPLDGPYTSGCTQGQRKANERYTKEEEDKAKGQDALAGAYGFGGGGGLTPAWATDSRNFYGGGKGANGVVDVTYKVSLPGGGGGSGTRVGGVNNAGKAYELKYKVKEGAQIVLKVGIGGVGGSASTDGTAGEASVIGDNEIVFFAGEGGKAATDAQKSSLTGGSGGRASIINQKNDIQSVAAGLIKTGAVTYTITPTGSSFKGENGATGQLKSGSTLLNYGFDGGLGGAPFGVASHLLNSARACGGGTKGANNQSAVCPNNTIDGTRGVAHDPVNNQYGGSGGGGGGVISTSFDLGAGGPGASGYVRIRWNEAEQE